MTEEAESEGKEVTEKLEQAVIVNLKAEKGEFKQVWKLAVGLLLIFLAITGGYLVFKNGLITGLLEKAPFFTRNDGASGGEQESVPDNSQSAGQETRDKLTAAHNQFGWKMFKELFKQQAEENVFISPASITAALSMTYNGAGGETKAAMAKTLQLEGLSVEEVNQASNQLMKGWESGDDPQVIMEVANSIWAKEGVVFKADFMEVNKQNYEAQITAIDFGLDTAADMINTWVSEQTKDEIPTIVQAPIPTEMVMYLINAIYFKGVWTYEFDPKLTEERKFTPLPNKNLVMIPMMNQGRDDFLYLETDDFQAVKLPYGEKQQFFMYVWLPKQKIEDLVDQLTSENWQEWQGGFAPKKGTLWLPKFKLEYKQELKEVLTDLGMGLAFSDQADFSGMTDEVELMISQVLHKTFIEVNEEGTEAAAATSVGMAMTSFGGDEKSFNMEVNRPFLVMIVDVGSGEMVFTGWVKNPK